MARVCFPVPVLLLFAALLARCGSGVHYVRPADWERLSARDSTIARYAGVLRGVTIFVDPGHGGDDRKNTGPAGDVVEADVNLRVALRLRDYLMQAGAKVLLSRDSDRSVAPAARAEQANANNADIFVSIHHNAAANSTTNYTATFYHARPGDAEYKPSSHDLARYIQRDLAYVTGNPGPLASFDGTMSDYFVYPGEGFAVLRGTNMTAVLVECAFFSSEYEEQRLRIEEFNDIEAWGIFRGISKYLDAGIPTIRFISPVAFRESRPKMEIEVKDRAEIRDESIRVLIDGREEGFSFNARTGRIAVVPAEDLAQGYHRFSAEVRSSSGNSSAPFEIYFTIGRAPVTLRSSAQPAIVPPDPAAFSSVTVTALDSAGAVIREPVLIRFTTSAGMDTILAARDGVARTSIYPGDKATVSFTASNGPVKTEGIVTTSPDSKYTRGIVMSSDGKPIGNASILLPDGSAVGSNPDGEYIIAGHDASGLEVAIQAPGYFGVREAFTSARVQDPVVLAPIARGTLLGKTFVLDVLSPAGSDNKARADVRVLSRLEELLSASGATVIPLPALEDARNKRETILAAHRDATILQFGMQKSGARISVLVTGNPGSRSLGEQITRVLPTYTSIGADRFLQRLPIRTESEKMRSVALRLPAPGPKSYEDRFTPLVASNIAWAVYNALLLSEGYKTTGTKIVEATVVDKASRTPAPFVGVELNLALRGMTDAKGIVRFRAVSISDDDVRVLDPDKFEVSGVKTDVMH